MRKFLSIFTRRSLRVDILTAFGGLLLVTVMVVIYYFYHNTTRVVLMLSDDLMEQTTQAVINRTVSFLTPITDLTEMSSRLAGTEVLPFSNRTRLEYYAIQTLHSYPQITQFFVGDQRGNFLLAHRQPHGVTATKYINRSRGSPITTWTYWDKDFQSIKKETNTRDTFDPRVRPWYKGAQQNRRLYLTDLYIFYTGEKPGITVSSPILDSKGQVLGVIGSDIDLNGLSTFLKSLRIGKHGLAFIINNKNELVAFPDPSRIIDRQAEDGVLRTVYVEELEIPSITAAFKRHRLSGADRVTVEVGGQRYLATFRKFPPSLGKPWQVGVVVPEADFIGTIEKFIQKVLLISLAILVVAMLLAVFLSRSISKPILLLSAETERIRNMGSLIRIKYGVVGHAVNLASRLESFTVGGQVLISESTFLAVADQFVVAGPFKAMGKGVESAIRLWEVRGLPNQEEKTLPPTVPGLTRLAKPLPVHLRLITGKQISPMGHEARLVQLSPAGAELETTLDLEVFAPLQVEIPGPSGESFPVDAKVVGGGEVESSYIIRFTGMDEAAAHALNRWLASS
jgi:hypothetical protein